MKSYQLVLASLAGLARLGSAAISPVVSGTPVGFANGVTGGGTATPVYPTTIAQLKSYLTSSSPQVIVISGEYNFVGSEGTQTEQACNSYKCAPAAGGQALLNTLNGCGSYSLYNVTIDKAGYEGINVASQKTLVGKNGATLNGKGLRFVGVSNIIVQNIEITNLNPAYVWGGDALTFSDTNNIWIDHVTTSKLGRQHYVFGHGYSNAVTISNSFLSGNTPNSATCDGHSYWALELVGSGDFITFYRNWVYYTSGRGPALSGNTIFHAVNNVWSANSGHLLEGTGGGKGLYEGNYFLATPNIVDSGFVGQLFTSDPADLSLCQSYLGRNCVTNLLGSGAGSFSGYKQNDWFVNLAGRPIVPASSASSIATSVINNAGNKL